MHKVCCGHDGCLEQLTCDEDSLKYYCTAHPSFELRGGQVDIFFHNHITSVRDFVPTTQEVIDYCALLLKEQDKEWGANMGKLTRPSGEEQRLDAFEEIERENMKSFRSMAVSLSVLARLGIGRCVDQMLIGGVTDVAVRSAEVGSYLDQIKKASVYSLDAEEKAEE